MILRRISTASLARLLGAWRGDAAGPAYRRLSDGVRLLVLDGRLPLGVTLPGERELAQALGVSRTTVTAAFRELREQGFLESRQGAGARTRLPTGPGSRGEPVLHLAPEQADVIDFASATLPAGEEVHRAYAAALSALPAHLPRHGYEAVGLLELRRAIADRYTRRGLPTGADQILVCHGALFGLSLLLRLLAGPGDRVVVDHPTYPHALDAILRAACRPVPVGLPAEGWDVDGVVAALRQSAPRFAYLIPDFHNPTGRWMGAGARAAIAAAAEQARTTVVFDETMLDLALEGPADPYGFEEPDGVVVRLGSMGKSFWGGLRIGWIRADAATIEALARGRTSLDLGTPVLEQLAAAALLADDEALLAERRAELRRRRDRLLRGLAERLPDWRAETPPGGLSLWVELPAAVSNALAATSERLGVRLAAGPRFGVDGAFERHLRLPFTLPPAEMDQALGRLALAYARLRPPSSAVRPSTAALV